MTQFKTIVIKRSRFDFDFTIPEFGDRYFISFCVSQVKDMCGGNKHIEEVTLELDTGEPKGRKPRDGDSMLNVSRRRDLVHITFGSVRTTKLGKLRHRRCPAVLDYDAWKVLTSVSMKDGDFFRYKVN